jgi:hypothetical protein
LIALETIAIGKLSSAVYLDPIYLNSNHVVHGVTLPWALLAQARFLVTLKLGRLQVLTRKLNVAAKFGGVG